MLLSQNLPIRVKYPGTQRSAPHHLLANTPPTSPSSLFPYLASDHLQTPASKDPFASQQLGGTPSILPASPFGLGGAALRMLKMAVECLDGHIPGGTGGKCIFGAWVECDQDSCNEEKERVLVRWKEGLEDMDMQARQVIPDKLEWSGPPGGRLVSKNASGNAGRSDAIQICLSALSSLPPVPHAHIATVARIKVGPSANALRVDVHILSKLLSVELIVERHG